MMIVEEGSKVSPIVARLAMMMEYRLSPGTDGFAWSTATPEGLLKRLKSEYLELVDLLSHDNADLTEVWQEAAELAVAAARCAEMYQHGPIARSLNAPPVAAVVAGMD